MPAESLGLFEVHLPVADLDRSIAFYRDRLRFPLAHVVPERQAAFLWIPSAGNAMLGLWGSGFGPQQLTLHVAFRASVADVVHAPKTLEHEGITPLGFDGLPTGESVVLAWMPAVSIYFRDPDGHLLEYLAMLPDAPRPDLSIVPWSEWQSMHG
jgi:lactoylglutathione lyase